MHIFVKLQYLRAIVYHTNMVRAYTVYFYIYFIYILSNNNHNITDIWTILGGMESLTAARFVVEFGPFVSQPDLKRL